MLRNLWLQSPFYRQIFPEGPSIRYNHKTFQLFFFQERSLNRVQSTKIFMFFKPFIRYNFRREHPFYGFIKWIFLLIWILYVEHTVYLVYETPINVSKYIHHYYTIERLIQYFQSKSFSTALEGQALLRNDFAIMSFCILNLILHLIF